MGTEIESMPSLPEGWRWQSLETICERVSVGHVGETNSVFTDKGGIPFIRSQNVRPGFLNLEDVKYVTEAFHTKSRKSQLVEGDILIVRVGHNRGDCCVVPKTTQLNCANIVFARPSDKRYSKFIGYFLNSRFGRASLLAVTTGSAQAVLNTKAVAKVMVPTPRPKEAESIASYLANIDNKIILNRQINQTLEQMAQALFKSWFVDFDPVVDNALDTGFFEQALDLPDELLRRAEERKAVRAQAGFKPLPAATRQLFPAVFEPCADPSLGLGGMIPNGWRPGMLGDLLSLRNERTKPSTETQKIPYVPIDSIGAKEPFLSEFKSGDEAMSSLILFKKGDILFGAMRPYFHKVCIAPFDGVTRSTVFTLTAKDFESRYYSLFQTYQESTIEYATLHSEGSTIPYAKWRGSLERLPTILPTIQLQRLFHEKIKLFIEQGNSNNEQSESLLKLRDTLLPKLISGELSLDDVELTTQQGAA